MTVLGAVQQLALVETYVDNGITKVRDSFRLTPSFGAVFYQSLDLGFPDVRSAVQENPGTDGTYDETQYLGARSVALTGTVVNNAFGDLPDQAGWDPSVGWNSASWFVRYLSGWASPARRYRLYFTDDSGDSRFVDVRGDSFTAPIEKGSENKRDFSLGMVNPSGKVYSFDTGDTASPDGRRRRLIRQTSVGLPGRTYPIVGPYARHYPGITGSTAVVYNGSVSNGFVANIYTAGAPMVDPRLTVTSPDKQVQSIGISGYTIPASSVVTFNTIEHTITTIAPDGVEISLDEYKTAPLQWPTLRPGLTSGLIKGYNSIGFTISSGDPAAYVELLYNDADLY